ncbi:hypothetical protein [Acinetobacter sp. MD2]|uniref:hypothetical protein n=1 Tax=Acinetobacter sp. MD2 TaxID=2600066 RepID=UPI002D1F2283|nr:hypothetical protein [Acinetobacter sp. MD2]MEB3768406.1 hypothetical protein [Acinetobacter sp. MD2]
MSFTYEQITCQIPKDHNHIDRNYIVIKAIFNNSSTQSERIRAKAWDLAKKVNPNSANDSTQQRDKDRLILDALGGVIAEEAWFYYINRVFGSNTVTFTEFNGSNGQIDLLLSNHKTIEIRSSFPRKGVKFAICHERFNFKNICKYNNLYKSSEIDKDFFGCCLFETQKDDISNAQSVVVYLIGGSTRAMMLDQKISFRADLVAEGDLTENRTNYQVIYLKDALDMQGFENYMGTMGYTKLTNTPLNQVF